VGEKKHRSSHRPYLCIRGSSNVADSMSEYICEMHCSLGGGSHVEN